MAGRLISGSMQRHGRNVGIRGLRAGYAQAEKRSHALRKTAKRRQAMVQTGKAIFRRLMRAG